VVAPPPDSPIVNPGKATVMVGNFGSELFDNIQSGVGGGNEYARHAHGFLLSRELKDGVLSISPGIATDWENSADGKTWTFTIRDGGKFHDGSDITPEDVLWTLTYSIGPQAQEYSRSKSSLALSKAMDRIELTGSNQVSVVSQRPAPDLLPDLSEVSGGWTIGVILPKREEPFDDKAALDAYNRNPIGAGYSKVVKQEKGDLITYERFEDFYHQPKYGLSDKRLKFSQLDVRLVPEEAVRVAALRAGDADIGPVSLSALEQVETGGGRIIFGQEGALLDVMTYGCWLVEHPCNDIKVRQAWNYAIDKELIRDQLFGGPEVLVLRGWFRLTPSTIGYTQELDPWPYDPDKARKLLADAGYPGGDGFGKVTFNVITIATLPLLTETAQVVGDMWKKELGLDVEVKVWDEAAIEEQLDNNEKLYGQPVWNQAETRIDASTNLRRNWTLDDRRDRPHNDQELFTLQRDTLAVFDPVKRVEALESTYQRLRSEAYTLGIGYVNIPWGVGPRIETWQPDPLSAYPSAMHTLVLK
jgi:peptide/nickel transport system substrate-binding protein